MNRLLLIFWLLMPVQMFAQVFADGTNSIWPIKVSSNGTVMGLSISNIDFFDFTSVTQSSGRASIGADGIKRSITNGSMRVVTYDATGNQQFPTNTLYPDGWKYSQAVDLIMDTDIGEDIDDMGDLSIAHTLMDQGEIRLLATMHCRSNGYGAPLYQIINTFEGRPDMPIGVAKNADYAGVGDYYGSFMQTNFYNSIKSSTNAQDATVLYRKILSSRPDKSVTILITGQLLNLSNLWASVSDTNSIYDGPTLISNKVKQIVVCGGIWPSGTEYNFSCSPSSAKQAMILNSISNVPIVYVGIELGNAALIGNTIRVKPRQDPVRAAFNNFYNVYGVTNRPAWAGYALLYIARGFTNQGVAYFTQDATNKGFATIDSSGNNIFTVATGWNQQYLRAAQSSTNFYTTNLDNLLMRPALFGGNPLYEATGDGSGGMFSTSSNAFFVSRADAGSIGGSNVLSIDTINGRMRIGQWISTNLNFDTYKPTRLLVVGSNATAGVATELHQAWIRNTGAGASYAQGLSLEIGRWMAPAGTEVSPNTIAQFYIKNGNNEADVAAAWSKVLALRSDGGMFIRGGTIEYTNVPNGNNPAAFTGPDARVGGTIFTNQTSAGNGAGTFTVIFTNNVKSNTVANLADCITVRATGTYGATANTDKTITLWLGNSIVFSNRQSINAGHWVLSAEISRSATATTYDCSVMLNTSSAAIQAAWFTNMTALNATTENMGLKLAGNGTSANDIVGKIWRVKYEPTP